MGRYVPKTYYNRRFLRIIIRTVITVSIALVIAFIVLFFRLKNYIIYNPADGTLRLEIPWLMDDQTPSPE